MDAKTDIKKADNPDQVSIHAPVMDAKSVLPVLVDANKVSIHAPVMDANLISFILSPVPRFNPRARDGREDHIG